MVWFMKLSIGFFALALIFLSFVYYVTPKDDRAPGMRGDAYFESGAQRSLPNGQ